MVILNHNRGIIYEIGLMIPYSNEVPMNYFAPYAFSKLEKSHTHGAHE